MTIKRVPARILPVMSRFQKFHFVLHQVGSRLMGRNHRHVPYYLLALMTSQACDLYVFFLSLDKT